MRRYFRSALLLALLCCGIFSCHYSNEYQTVNADNKFTISVPGWMKKTDDLKPGAPFQYSNRFRNFYAIGTADDKVKFNKPTAAVINENLDILRKAMANPVLTDSTGVEIGGLKGIRAEIYGKMNGENIYFSEVVLEGSTQIYHLSIWTRSEDRKLRFKEDINRILSSFKPI